MADGVNNADDDDDDNAGCGDTGENVPVQNGGEQTFGCEKMLGDEDVDNDDNDDDDDDDNEGEDDKDNDDAGEGGGGRCERNGGGGEHGQLAMTPPRDSSCLLWVGDIADTRATAAVHPLLESYAGAVMSCLSTCSKTSAIMSAKSQPEPNNIRNCSMVLCNSSEQYNAA